jgi:hypothetical protein
VPDGRYQPVSRPYVRRFAYRYSEHVFDKMEIIDIALGEFERLLGSGEVIEEAPAGRSLRRHGAGPADRVGATAARRDRC